MENKEHIITFIPLAPTHFYLLETWLNTPHVAHWYTIDTDNTTNDNNASTSKQLISASDIYKKYRTYVDNYTIVDGIKKPIRGYIIECNSHPIGYIQYYHTHDFPRIPEITAGEFTLDLASMDIFIGDRDYIGKGLGPRIISQFLNELIWDKFDACLIDPETANIRAVRAYEKAGFVVYTNSPDTSDAKTTRMIATKPADYKPVSKCKTLCCCKG